MNRYILICREIMRNPQVTQRELSLSLNLSLGSINKLISEYQKDGLIHLDEKSYHITPKGEVYMEEYKVNNAIIMAAGFGSRFVPLTFDTPKGLLKVFGVPMIERQIQQLKEAGIDDITIVVGYLKESFEYLIDNYQVKLLYNPEYKEKNTLATLYHAKHLLKNTYILSSDNWLRTNVFHAYEGGSWYCSSYMEGDTAEWCLKADKKDKILSIEVGGRNSYVMYGPAYFSKDFSEQFLMYLSDFYNRPGTEHHYWEEILKEHIKNLPIHLNAQPADTVYEFENLEELRVFDPEYRLNSKNEALKCISHIFKIPESDIVNIHCLKSGMTNKSFVFSVHGESYIFRIPGKGTETLVNRKEEKTVCEAIADLNLSEEILYFNGDTGQKIARFYEGSRNAVSDSSDDIQSCMSLLRRFHEADLKTEHSFDIRERIEFYEKLCKDADGITFTDYEEVKNNMIILMDRLDEYQVPKRLSHIDSNPDNFIFEPNGKLRLIDWEYAGMCDYLIDISMWAIYSYYNKEETDSLIETYLGRTPENQEKIRIYSYMALGGFLWALWGLYKSAFGEEFGEYIITMYRYGKKYFKIVQSMLE